MRDKERVMKGDHLEQSGLCLAPVQECAHVGKVGIAQRAYRRYLSEWQRQMFGYVCCPSIHWTVDCFSTIWTPCRGHVRDSRLLAVVIATI